ncbi:hypothetical protein [Bifidobacterium biavatii]|uniref:Uncharacterized protein n=1 Tax=Bifidobacterium biavatii DSM 23969 TaxID=1437608 RepID=A0A086ZHV9_9BIFI|nr:hypothetical protein [Bifidobacterium biavatii]KFI46109.1 hypothetical protein BBIA_2074 [Bifidobacterium biavatii DSM 23969]
MNGRTITVMAWEPEMVAGLLWGADTTVLPPISPDSPQGRLVRLMCGRDEAVIIIERGFQTITPLPGMLPPVASSGRVIAQPQASGGGTDDGDDKPADDDHTPISQVKSEDRHRISRRQVLADIQRLAADYRRKSTMQQQTGRNISA